jgi:hypothetical protein
LNVVLVAVYRHSSVVKDDHDVRVIMRERSGVSHLSGVKLKVKR